jgi:hypothetical protein
MDVSDENNENKGCQMGQTKKRNFLKYKILVK